MMINGFKLKENGFKINLYFLDNVKWGFSTLCLLNQFWSILKVVSAVAQVLGKA